MFDYFRNWFNTRDVARGICTFMMLLLVMLVSQEVFAATDEDNVIIKFGCQLLNLFTKKIGRIVGAFGIIMLGIGASTGKTSWTVFAILFMAIIMIIAAPQLVDTLFGSIVGGPSLQEMCARYS